MDTANNIDEPAGTAVVLMNIAAPENVAESCCVRRWAHDSVCLPTTDHQASHEMFAKESRRTTNQGHTRWAHDSSCQYAKRLSSFVSVSTCERSSAARASVSSAGFGNRLSKTPILTPCLPDPSVPKRRPWHAPIGRSQQCPA